MNESLALRDLVTREKAIQVFLNIYLGLSDLYIVHSEKEMNKGLHRPRPGTLPYTLDIPALRG
jgi:hypothetical protein